MKVRDVLIALEQQDLDKELQTHTHNIMGQDVLFVRIDEEE